MLQPTGDPNRSQRDCPDADCRFIHTSPLSRFGASVTPQLPLLVRVAQKFPQPLVSAGSAQSNHFVRLNRRKPIEVGLALVATPYRVVEKRHAGDRRPDPPLHCYESETSIPSVKRIQFSN